MIYKRAQLMPVQKKSQRLSSYHGSSLYPAILESRFASERVGELEAGSAACPIEVMQNKRVGYSCVILVKHNRFENSDRSSQH